MIYSNTLSSPTSKKTSAPQTPSTHDKSSPASKFSLFTMITPSHLDTSNSESLLTRSNSNKEHDEAIIEDRFIPSRRLIKELDLNENYTKDEFNFQGDPQSMSVAEIYSEEILGKSSCPVFQQNFQNELECFKNKNILRFKVQQSCQRKNINLIHPTINELTNSYSKSRKINKNPCKVLDAPALTDDFYLNLIDWSNENQLAVGLGNCIYLWNAITSKVTRLCELPHNDLITSVCWSKNGINLAIGCNKGQVQMWDANREKLIRKFDGHQTRVGAMSWSRKFLSTGSRDKTILHRDLLSPKSYVMKITDHTQQICGLKWSGDEQYLASGGNDNKVIVWNENGQAINKFADHKAAVKAIAWSPHQHGLLATGGGTADKMIKMRNIFTGEIICSQETGSQVCNLQFSKSLHEIVSTHGYSQNQVNVWSYPSMKKVATLKGHTHRVLYLATSPDGSTIVTGAGDQTLRFWNIFPSIHETNTSNQSQLEEGLNFR